MSDLPSGTVTFLFTDIQGSTRLWEQHPQQMPHAHARHAQLILACVQQHNGLLIRTRGEGDSTFSVFTTALDAVAAACAFQCALAAEPWPQETVIRVRAALHTGTVTLRDHDYNSSDVNRCARLRAIAHGGQTLISQTVYELTHAHLPVGVTLQDLGLHRLKDLQEPEHVYQVCHPDLEDTFPALLSLQNRLTNLPQQLTSFIGREQEMAEIEALLSSTRLLTLTGSGGCGKTRLAVQVGAEVLDGYKDGVWLVELAGLTEAELVPQTVASVLGLREEGGRPLLQTVRDYLRDRHLLLMLDNCEHLLNTCAHLADALLKTCPHVTILATSREPLGIAGERSWRVPSLLTLDPADLPLEEKDVAAVLLEYDACRLFVDRAVLQRQEFVLTRHNAPAVASVCHRLDGIPLAIELAGARVRSLSVEEIDGRLDNRFRLLTGGSKTALPRQQTLRALIDWSYDLLSEPEKRLLGRLSVFSGGWRLEAAEEVGAGEDTACGEGIEAWEVLDLLTSLADKSLVMVEIQAETARYRLLETVRQYARERLEKRGESEEVRRRHRDHFLGLAEEAQPKLIGADQAQWLGVLESEHDNLRQALSCCLEAPEGAEAGLRLGAALQQFWDVRGHFGEGRSYLGAVLARAEGPGQRLVRARALNGAGILAWRQGDTAAARALYEESLAIFRELGDKRGIARSLNNLGTAANDVGDAAAAQSLHEASLTIRRELGDRQGIADSLNNLGLMTYERGDYAAARALLEESLANYRELGDKRGSALSLLIHGRMASDQDDDVTAQLRFEESLSLFCELGDRRNIAWSYLNLGSVAHHQGDEDTARTRFAESLSLFEEVGDKQGSAWSLLNLGRMAGDQDDYVAAQARLAESLSLFSELGDKRGIAWSLLNLGRVAGDQDDYALAQTRFAESLSLFNEVGDKQGIANALEASSALAGQHDTESRRV